MRTWKSNTAQVGMAFTQFAPNFFQFPNCIREVIKKKNWDESVRLTDWVDPPSPPHESVRKM